MEIAIMSGQTGQGYLASIPPQITPLGY